MFLVFFRLLSQAQDAIIEVQLNNVWVTGIVGNPVHVACKHCRTKIDANKGFASVTERTVVAEPSFSFPTGP